MADVSIKGLRTFTTQEALNTHIGKVIRVIPVIPVAEVEDEDIIFNSTEIPNAVSHPGGTSRLVSITINNIDGGHEDMELIFHQTAKDLGTPVSAPDITDANFRAMNVLGHVKIVLADWINTHSSSDSTQSIYTNASSANDPMHFFLLQADEGSTSVYFSAMATDTHDYASTSDLEFVFHIEYR